MKSSIAVVALFLVVASSVSVAQRCPGDNNGDGMTTVDEIVASVDSALNGCGDGERFVDNGDGTISDYETGLMWEKKADVDSGDVNCTSTEMSDQRPRPGTAGHDGPVYTQKYGLHTYCHEARSRRRT